MHGLRLWSQNQFFVNTTGTFVLNQMGDKAPFDIANNTLGWAATAPETQASVTVGLEGVHPLCLSSACTAPAAAPWTNVRIKSYSDWGVVLRYATNPVSDKTGGLTITMANGSPFVWFEKPAALVAPRFSNSLCISKSEIVKVNWEACSAISGYDTNPLILPNHVLPDRKKLDRTSYVFCRVLSRIKFVFLRFIRVACVA